MVSNGIEAYWQDAVIYVVCFQVRNSNGNYRDIKKNLIFKEQLSEQEVADIITRKFSNVQKVKYVDCWSEALQLK